MFSFPPFEAKLFKKLFSTLSLHFFTSYLLFLTPSMKIPLWSLSWWTQVLLLRLPVNSVLTSLDYFSKVPQILFDTQSPILCFLKFPSFIFMTFSLSCSPDVSQSMSQYSLPWHWIMEFLSLISGIPFFPSTPLFLPCPF